MTEYPNWFVQGGAQANFEKHLLHLRDKRIDALQIGAYTGDATEWLFNSVLTNPDSTLTDVDTWEGSDEPIHTTLDWNSVEDVYNYRTKTYQEATRLYKEKMTSDAFFKENIVNYDFIYIDGDHTAPAVLKDGINAVKFIKPGGILAFDDYMWRSGKGPAHDPYPAINAIMLCFADEFDVLDVNLQVWLKKKEQ
jgi:predicted O-methyltransferase YrrM